MMEKMNGYFPDIAIPPGETIKEFLEDRGMTQEELAIRLGFSTKHTNLLINGKEPITQQTALKLESVFNVPAKFWNNLESHYRETIARLEQSKSIVAEQQLLKEIPYKELIEFGYIEDDKNKSNLVINLRKFFGISNLYNIEKLLPEIAFRKSEKEDYSLYAIAAWIRMCEINTEKIETNELSKPKLKSYLPEIRGLIGKEPEYFVNRLTEILSDCGVAFTLTHHLRKAPIQGMIKHLKNKVIMGMTIRRSVADIFWFSLFHEIGHILLHGKKDIFIDLENDIYDSQKEEEANKFAANTLIPPANYLDFIDKKNFTKQSIINFAKQIDIHPCIVVGRLQKEGHVRYNDTELNSLKIKYKWVS